MERKLESCNKIAICVSLVFIQVQWLGMGQDSFFRDWNKTLKRKINTKEEDKHYRMMVLFSWFNYLLCEIGTPVFFGRVRRERSQKIHSSVSVECLFLLSRIKRFAGVQTDFIIKHEILNILDVVPFLTVIFHSVYPSCWKGIVVNAVHKDILLCCQSRGEKSPCMPALFIRQLEFYFTLSSSQSLLVTSVSNQHSSLTGVLMECRSNTGVPPPFYMTSLLNVSQKSLTHCHQE